MSAPKPTLLALVLALVYFVWPVDLIPDIFGPFGRIDDLLVFLFVAWQAYQYKRKAENRAPNADADKSRAQDPYELFGITPSATRDEIESRYRELAQQYHPDKVSHLGEDLQKVAHEKMLQITEAYRKLLAAAGPQDESR
jgi:hypothetical protein